MKKNLFLVSSAINATYSVFDKQTRISQTKDTLNSIRKYCENSDICMIDGGNISLTKIEIDEYFPNIKDFHSVSDDRYVIRMQGVKNGTYKKLYDFDIRNIPKNAIEVYMYLKYFRMLNVENKHDQYDRIFKLSGRYSLNENFDLNKHLDAKNKIVIIDSKPSQLKSHVTHGVKNFYMTRLWSFDSSMLSTIISIYENCLKNMEYVYASGGFIDIEHSLYKFMDKEIVTTLPVMGVQGITASLNFPVLE